MQNLANSAGFFYISTKFLTGAPFGALFAFLWAPYMSNSCSDKHASVQHESHQTKILVTVASAVIAALLLWIGGTVSNNQVSLATLQADMLNLRVDIQEAADRSDDFRKEYNSDKRDLEKRLRALESQ